MADARIQLQRRLERGARPVVHARIAIRAADEDVCLRQRPGRDDLFEEALGGVDFLQPQISRRQRKGQLRIVARGAVGFLQLLDRLRRLAAGEERLREEAMRSDIFRIRSRQPRQNCDRARRLAHLKGDQRQLLERRLRVDRRRRRAQERIARLGEATFVESERSDHHPAGHQCRSVMALGDLQLALAKARLGCRDDRVETVGGIRSRLRASWRRGERRDHARFNTEHTELTETRFPPCALWSLC